MYKCIAVLGSLRTCTAGLPVLLPPVISSLYTGTGGGRYVGARTRDGEDSLGTASTMSLLDRICMYAHTRATRRLRVEGENTQVTKKATRLYGSCSAVRTLLPTRSTPITAPPLSPLPHYRFPQTHKWLFAVDTIDVKRLSNECPDALASSYASGPCQHRLQKRKRYMVPLWRVRYLVLEQHNQVASLSACLSGQVSYWLWIGENVLRPRWL